MSEIMEAPSDATNYHLEHQRSKNKFKFTSFPDYVCKVQQLSFSHTVETASEGKALKTGVKKQNLSRAFSCCTASSNSPKPSRVSNVAVKLPPLHASRRRQQATNSQLKISACQDSNCSKDSPLRPTSFDGSKLTLQETSLHRASSFPLINDCTDKITALQNVTMKSKRAVMSKSPYLQPLVHKTYWKEGSSLDRSPKLQRKKKMRQKVNSTAPADKQDNKRINPVIVTKKCSVNEANSLPIPRITLRTATPSVSEDLSLSLTGQFTARGQLAAELDKLNKDIQDIVLSVEHM